MNTNNFGQSGRNPNHCIACTVQQCAHHCGSDNYCSLDRILVGTHEY